MHCRGEGRIVGYLFGWLFTRISLSTRSNPRCRCLVENCMPYTIPFHQNGPPLCPLIGSAQLYAVHLVVIGEKPGHHAFDWELRRALRASAVHSISSVSGLNLKLLNSREWVAKPAKEFPCFMGKGLFQRRPNSGNGFARNPENG